MEFWKYTPEPDSSIMNCMNCEHCKSVQVLFMREERKVGLFVNKMYRKNI
jgi:hypothetical protein